MTSIVNDEELAENVKNYQVLYDKSHAEFHRKDIRKNAWNKVAKALGIEDGKRYISELHI